ncbi:MAG: precorrin-8X methylmutase [Dehalococcoidia bacterium]
MQARESKAALMQRDIPYITIEGTRGGSSATVATINALLNLAHAAR